MNERDVYLARVKTILSNARKLGQSDEKIAEDLADKWYWEIEHNRKAWFDTGYRLAEMEEGA